MNFEEIQHQLEVCYGDGANADVPRPVQWARILERDENQGFTLINFFKFRHRAQYANHESSLTGRQAFDQYAAVSIPAMERAGGQFLLVTPFEGVLIGPDETWDLVAIGSYPDRAAFLALYQDPTYQAAFEHRSAACAAQKVLIVTG